MPKPTPDKIRASVVRMLALDLDLPLILVISGLSEQTIWSIRKRWEEEGLFRARKPVGVGRPRILDIGDVWYLCDRLAQDPDVYLDELQRELSNAAGIDVHISTVWRALQRLGVTRKITNELWNGTMKNVPNFAVRYERFDPRKLSLLTKPQSIEG
ncbi:unnamed protein product [Rhizoctonia solani]|uniref:Winged helix-turn helix domain-containing protein n=1 Tax=Rhizoctonia solani TaxID=456999 RepID=A0A8H3GPV9_9AGAM|nr:unnamed protein product [Rhizoctonia solani]